MKFILAPLADFTDAPFRRMCFEGGADLCYSEMVSAAALAHGNSPTRHLMEVMPGEGPVACQIFGAREEDVAKAAREIDLIRDRFTELNLNAGCPMQRITRAGAGAKLIEDPEKVYRLLKVMAENTSLPITLKTRLGPRPGEDRIFELADAAEKAGAKGLIVHARYTSQMHGGEVHYGKLAEVVEHTSLPVIGNGSVKTAKDVANMAASGVQGVMIGRASLADPLIFAKLKNLSAEIPSPWGEISPAKMHLKYLLEFREILVRNFPNDRIPSVDGFASVKMHIHLFRYFNSRPGAAALRAKLNSVRTLTEIETIMQ